MTVLTELKRPLDVELWRDHDMAVNALPGMALGAETVCADPTAAALDLYERGVRRVDLPIEVDLSTTADPAVAIQTVAFIRDVTSLGIAVGWRVSLADDRDWRTLNHLYPPAEVRGGAETVWVAPGDETDGKPIDAVGEWRKSFYLCKCVYRHGPGFVQVRDRRRGELARFTIDDGGYVAAIEPLLAGTAASGVPERVLADYEAEDLVLRMGDLVCWLPYRTRRWPTPAQIV